jgi:hypothetical protein
LWFQKSEVVEIAAADPLEPQGSDARGEGAKYMKKQGLFLLPIAVVMSAVAAYVGGTNFALLIVSSWLLSNEFYRRGETAYMSVLQGHLASVCYLFAIGSLIIPVFRNSPIINTWLFSRTPLDQPEYARSYVYNELVEIRQLPSIALSLLPVAFCLVFILLRERKRTRSAQIPVVAEKRSWIGLVAPQLVVMTPVLIAAHKKLRDPLEYVVGTMSGDGRNFFLIVENIRVTARPTSIFQILGQGDFLPSLAAHLSTGLGASGRLDFRDQYSVAGIYVYMAAIITASLGAYLTQLLRSRGAKNQGENLDHWVQGADLVMAPLIVVAGLFVANFGPVANEVFRSGFFSLYGAMALLVAYLAVSKSEITTLRVGMQAVTLTLLSVIYPLVVGIVAVMFVIDFVLAIQNRIRPALVALGGTFLFLVLRVMEPWDQVLRTLQQRLTLEGAIIPLNPNIVVFAIVISLTGLLLLQGANVRLIFRDLAMVSIAGLLLRYVIIGQRRKSNLNGAGYYGAKNDYAIAFIAVFVATALVVYAVTVLVGKIPEGEDRWTRVTKRASWVLAVVWAYILYGATAFFSPSQTLLDRASIWTQPRASSIEFAVGTWDEGDYIYLSSDDPGEARLLNFWLPYFWRAPGWHWVYWEFSNDPDSVCALLEQDDARLVMSNPEVVESIESKCADRIRKTDSDSDKPEDAET